MHESAKSVLEAAVRRPTEPSDKVALLKPVAVDELHAFQKDLGVAAPADIRELLMFASGFERTFVGRVDFLGRELSIETPFRSVPILGDGYGNFWIVDAGARSGTWGAVIFWCHDPPVAVIQAPTLAAFLKQILDATAKESNDALALAKQYAQRVWSDDPYAMSVQQARSCGDSILQKFAESLADSYSVADLRERMLGSGFCWGKSDLEPIRHEEELIFAFEPKKKLWERLFGKTSRRE